MEHGIEAWVRSAPDDQIDFRKAVHLVLMAISINEELSKSMVMKGGVLLGIRYGSGRYTTDIDFSTSEKMNGLDIDDLRSTINLNLLAAEVELPYGLKCSVQKIKRLPSSPDATFPSLKITVGYAKKDNGNAIRKLEQGQASNVVHIDYSFNEVTGSTQEIAIDGEDSITAYDFISLMAEKFRSILQQEVRQRNRRQDIYDLCYLIENFAECTDEEKAMVLEMLIEKSKNKGIEDFLHIGGLDDERIKSRTSDSFEDLRDELEDELPDFDLTYNTVNDYYKNMPWSLC